MIETDALGNDMNPYHIAKNGLIFVQSKKQRRQIIWFDYSAPGVAMLNVPAQAIEGTIQIAFPKQFKQFPYVVCSFGGYEFW